MFIHADTPEHRCGGQERKRRRLLAPRHNHCIPRTKITEQEILENFYGKTVFVSQTYCSDKELEEGNEDVTATGSGSVVYWSNIPAQDTRKFDLSYSDNMKFELPTKKLCSEHKTVER